MVSHNAVAGSLDAYADGTLPEAERAKIAAHLRSCAECGASLREIHQLHDILNDLPEMPAVPFARFWSKLEPRLPSQAKKRAPLLRPARLAAGFALAVLASLVGVVALASDSTMPDSPLYSVKHFRQDVQLNLADARERPRLELWLGHQRLAEALAMVHSKRNDLAAASLRDFSSLLSDATPRLKDTAGGKPATDEVTDTLKRLEKELTTIREAVEQDGPDPGDADVAGAAQDAQNDVSQAETSIETTAPVVESASPSPAIEQPSPAPAPSAEATSAAPSEPPAPEQEPAPTGTTGSPAP
jgi:hypothetical protein